MKVSKQDNRSRWIWRFLFVIVGFVLSFGILEGVFNIFADLKKIHTPIALTKKDQQKYKILTLGESTTASLTGLAWPELLEKILNEKVGEEKFRVINAGVSGTTTREVYERLDTYLSLYRPQIVISMLGINDITYPDASALAQSPYQRAVRTFYESRLYRFFSILVRQIVGKESKEIMRMASHCTDASMGEMAFQLLVADGEKPLESAILKYISTYPLSYHGYELIVDFYAQRGSWKEVLAWTKRARFMDPYIRYCANESAAQSPDRYNELTRHVSWAFDYIATLENVAQNALNNPSSVGNSWYKDFANTLHTPESDTAIYYPRIAKKLKDANITHIVMQYPMLSLERIQKMLGGIGGIVYVSNEQNFQNALQTIAYDDVFVDHFTGVFGHTTEFGSKLIAEQVASAVLNVVQGR